MVRQFKLQHASRESSRCDMLQRVMNARQFGLKLIANVTYGYTSAGFSGRMPMAEIADSIVQVSPQSCYFCFPAWMPRNAQSQGRKAPVVHACRLCIRNAVTVLSGIECCHQLSSILAVILMVCKRLRLPASHSCHCQNLSVGFAAEVAMT